MDKLTPLFQLLRDVILPNLERIENGQFEQRVETERLNRNFDEFRSEMQICFAELRAELTTIRAQLEDTLVTLREPEAAQETEAPLPGRKLLIH